MRLEGSVAIVTGGASGIGEACCRRMIQEGARVAIFDVHPETPAGADALGIRCDVSDAAQVQAAVDQVLDAFGAVHVLVNSAGIAVRKTVSELEEADWDRCVAVNLKEVGIAVQLSGQITGSATKLSAGDMRLVRQRIASPDIAVALPALFASLGELSTAMETPEQEYAAERAPIDAFRIIPLVHVSESLGLGPQVRDWMPPRWGGWRLEDVWLAPVPAPTAAGTTP